MRFKIAILAAMSVICLTGQQAPTTGYTAKIPSAAEAKDATVTPPAINTAKIWRLIAQAQALRQQANDTPQAKAAAAADDEVRKESNSLQVACGPNFALGYQEDPKAENKGDLICLAKPKETAAPDAAKKEK